MGPKRYEIIPDEPIWPRKSKRLLPTDPRTDDQMSLISCKDNH